MIVFALLFVILAENKYTEYKSSHKKLSDFCTQNLKYRHVKNHDFVQKYFQDVSKLIAAIQEYKRVSNSKEVRSVPPAGRHLRRHAVCGKTVPG